MTTIELLQEAHKNADALRELHKGGPAGREFALSATAIEDAIMRFNRGQAETRGERRDFDFEKRDVDHRI